MSDQRIRHLFDLLDSEPSADFEANLRRRVLDELSTVGTDLPGGSPSPPLPDLDPDQEHLIVITERPDASPGQRRSRRLAIMLTAAAAIAALVVTGILVSRDDETSPATTAPATTAPATTAPAPTTAAPATTSTSLLPTSTAPPPTTAAPQTTTRPRPTLPLDVAPGTYVAGRLPLAIEFTTTQPWRRVLELADLLVLGRGEDGFGGEFLITVDRFDEVDPVAIIASACARQAVLGDTTSTTLLGEPATMVVGSMTADCLFSALGGQGWVVPGDYVFSVFVAIVAGHVVVVWADGPTADADALLAEVSEIVASMRVAA